MWLLSAYSFSPYSADWWECELEMRGAGLVDLPKWSGMSPCIVTHKQLAKDVSLGEVCRGDDWGWSLCSDYTVTIVFALEGVLFSVWEVDGYVLCFAGT